MDIEQARFNMIEQQIRPWEVLDQRILDCLSNASREDFVPQAYRHLAFADINIPLDDDEVMMSPKVEARLVQELNLESGYKVLEIGTGSGFVTALLAKLSQHVFSVDIKPEYSARAAEKLKAHGIENITLETGDGCQGWPSHAPYDAIILTGSVPELPQAFKDQLSPGGRIVAVIGDPPIMEATAWRRIDQHAWQTVSLFDTSIPPLKNSERPPEFVF